MLSSLENQARRRAALFAMHRALLPTVFHPDGTLVCGGEMDPRERAWHGFAAFAGNAADIRLGNAILGQSTFGPHYDFWMSALLQLWVRHRERFEPDVRERTEACIAASGHEQMQMPGFVGMNDNFGAMAVLVLALLGELTGRREFTADAAAKLRGLVERLDDAGAISEYNSPTYTGLTLACMADIAAYTTDPELRALAARVERQTWYDVCGRFHPGTSQAGGPTSRSYMADSCGHMHNLRWVLATAFGDEAQFCSPLRYSYGQANHLVLHHFDPAFMPCNGGWLAAVDYHVPEECDRIMASRPYPFQTVGTATNALAWWPDDFRIGAAGREPHIFRPFRPQRWAKPLLTTWQNEDLCLGTASGVGMCGTGSSADTFHLSYRRRRPSPGAALGIEDVRTCFSRYVFNGAQPSATSSLVPDQGIKTAVQHGAAAMVLYRPDIVRVAEITSMRLLVILPLHCNAPDEIWLGDRQLPGLEGEAREAVPVFIRDGIATIAFRPLEVTDYGRPAAVRVERHEDFLTIGFLNYEGPPRSLNFPYQAAPFTQNGFVVEAACGEPLEALRERVGGATISDTFERGIRQVSYERPGLSLRLQADPNNLADIPPAWIDGRIRRLPRFAWSAPGRSWRLGPEHTLIEQAE